MAYFKSAMCGGLKVSNSDFTEVDKVITSESMMVDVYTPSASEGVTFNFDEEKYADVVGNATTTYTASVADLLVTWNDGTSDITEEEMAEAGISEIVGAVDGSTITITYEQEEVPRTELVGTPFIAPMCGGIAFDDGVFKKVVVDGKDVITTVGTASVSGYFRSNCSLLFDSEKFSLDDDRAVVLK